MKRRRRPFSKRSERRIRHVGEEVVFSFDRTDLRDRFSIIENADRYAVTSFGQVPWKVRLQFSNRHVLRHPHTFPRLSASVNAATFRCMPASLARLTADLRNSAEKSD